MDLKIVSARIRKLRDKKKWTQDQIAKKLGLTRHSTYANWEHGKKGITMDKLVALSELHGVTLDYLTGLTDNPTMTLMDNQRQLIFDLELSDTEIIEKYNFTVDGRSLTEAEAQELIVYIRTRRSMIEQKPAH